MVSEACLLSNAYYPRTPDYTLYFGIHVCWSEHSDSSFVYGFMSLDYGLGTMTATTYVVYISQLNLFERLSSHLADFNARNKSLTAKLFQQGIGIIHFETFFLVLSSTLQIGL